MLNKLLLYHHNRYGRPATSLITVKAFEPGYRKPSKYVKANQICNQLSETYSQGADKLHICSLIFLPA